MGLITLAVVAIAFLIGNSFFGNEGGLRQALRPYSDGYIARPTATRTSTTAGTARASSSRRHRSCDRGTVDATGSFAEQRGFLTKVEGMLEPANLPLRPAEALFFYAAGLAIIAVLFIAIADSPIVALIGIVVVALIPPAVITYLGNRRRKQFESLLPDTLQLLASTMGEPATR